MEVFYAEPGSIRDNIICLSAGETRHAVRVLRYRVGDAINVVDGEGNEYRCTIAALTRNQLKAQVITQTRRAREALVEVTLAVGIPKGRKLDGIVEMATEAGVARIVPVRTKRTEGGITPAKLRRLETLAQAAMKSSTRTMLPRIVPEQTFEQLLESSVNHDVKLIAYEAERKTGLHDIALKAPRRVMLAIGPEGGFEEHEVSLAQEQGFVSFSLGPRRLRVETACITALSMLLYELHEI